MHETLFKRLLISLATSVRSLHVARRCMRSRKLTHAQQIAAMWDQYAGYGFKPSHSLREVYFISLMSAGSAQHALLFVSEGGERACV
eukprot:755875-Hanusia_phi.AAC.6